MTDERFSGYGRKRPQVNKPVSLLHLDSQNPRLPEEAQGKSEEELLNVLYKEFFLDELADSMVENGYFDEEPLVAVPHKLPSDLKDADPNSKEFRDFINRGSTELIVVEGNRRLATAKLLLSRDSAVFSWPETTLPPRCGGESLRNPHRWGQNTLK